MALRLIARSLLLLAASILLTPNTIAQQQPAGDDVVRVNTSLVQTDFMVFDKQGRFIDGLKREQFVLKVDGKQREISFFDRITAGSRNEEAQLAAARGDAASISVKPPAVPLDRGHTVMFFLDDIHLSQGSLGQVRAMLKKFVERDLRQNDQAAIVTASGQLGFLQQLTDNPDVMSTAIDRLRTQQPLTLESGERHRMTEYQALMIEQNNSDVLGYFVDQILKDSPRFSRQTAEQVVRMRASQLLENSSQITARSLAALKSLIENTSRVPGRKLIFFISDGFILSRNHADNANRMQTITSAAGRAGTVVYAIDARGLAAGLPDASDPPAFDPQNRLSRNSIGELRTSQDGMNALANDSGGRAFFNSNSLSLSVDRALKETSVYYLLAWRPEADEQRNAKFRRLELSIAGRPELIVRFRSGFGESSDEIAKRNKESQTTPARKTPAEELIDSLYENFPKTTLPVSVELTFLAAEPDGATLTTSMKIATDSLPTERQAEVPAAVLELAGAVLDERGKAVSTFNQQVTVRGTPNGGSVKLPENFFYNHVSPMKPGLYQVRVAALDLKGRTRGSANEWITIPDLQSKQLSMSSLILGERPAAADDFINSTPVEGATLGQVSVNLDHRFARTSYLRFVAYIYNANPSGAAAPQAGPGPGTLTSGSMNPAALDLATQVQIFRDNEPVITSPLRKLTPNGADLRRIPYSAEIRLDQLRPGPYLLQVTVLDRLTKTTTTRKTAFEIY